jgi:hypothetical protein
LDALKPSDDVIHFGGRGLGWVIEIAATGILICNCRHDARLRLRARGLSWQEAEAKLDEIQAHALTHPDEVRKFKLRYWLARLRGLEPETITRELKKRGLT